MSSNRPPGRSADLACTPSASGVGRGVVCAAQLSGGAVRYVLVAGVDAAGVADVVLLSDRRDLAAPWDLLMPPAMSSGWVVQPDLRSVMYVALLTPAGWLDVDSLELAGEGVARWEGRSDRRWDHKAAEGAALRSLCASTLAAELAEL